MRKTEILSADNNKKKNLVVFWIQLFGDIVSNSLEFHGMFIVGRRVKVASVRRMVSAKLGMRKERVVLGLVGEQVGLED